MLFFPSDEFAMFLLEVTFLMTYVFSGLIILLTQIGQQSSMER